MKPAYRRIADAPNQYTLRSLAGSGGAVDPDSSAYAILRRYAEEWEGCEPLPSYLVREAGKYPLHPTLADALATVYGIRTDWEGNGIENVMGLPEGMAYQILCHWPHVSERDPALVAYSQNIEKGEDDIQTRCGLGKYLAKLGIPGHVAEKIVHLCREDDARYEILRGMSIPQAMVAVIGQDEGPNSCMTSGWRPRRGGSEATRHPYIAFAREGDGWGLAIRRGSDGQIQARALVCAKMWLRSYGPISYGHYAPADPALEAWLESQGYGKAESWEGCRIDVSHDIFPYLDGDAQYVDNDGFICCDEPDYGYRCDSTNGTADPIETEIVVEAWNGRDIPEQDAVYMARYYSHSNGRHIEGYAWGDDTTCLDDGDYFLDRDVVLIKGWYYVMDVDCFCCADCGEWIPADDLVDGLCVDCRPEEESEEENA